MTEQEYIKELESLVGIGSNDLAKKAFLSYCKVANQMSKRLDKFDIDKNIGSDPKEDKIYDRTMAIQKEMPNVIENINNLRKTLGIAKIETEEAFIDSIAEKRQ